MVAEGLSNWTIARCLDISKHTVKFHGATILDRLRARSGINARRARRTHCEPNRRSRMILVTGATGTNGRLVVEALLRAGAPVRAMVQDPTRGADLERAGAQLAVADFDRPDTLDGALAGVERSLLLSAVDERLVEREARFVERAKKAGLRHLVKFSAIGAHLAASFTFGRQHGRSERLIVDSGLTFTFIQPNFFMQNLLWSA
jgi:uncharacterized protein YbjT (DUF2867 family)